MKCIAKLVDRFLNLLAPPIDLLDVLGPDDLSDIEADLETLPGCVICQEKLADWERELHESWHKDLPASTPMKESLHGGNHIGGSPSPVEPADADRQGSGASVGGFVPKSDEQLIEELVADYRSFVRDCFKRRG